MAHSSSDGCTTPLKVVRTRYSSLTYLLWRMGTQGRCTLFSIPRSNQQPLKPVYFFSKLAMAARPMQGPVTRKSL